MVQGIRLVLLCLWGAIVGFAAGFVAAIPLAIIFSIVTWHPKTANVVSSWSLALGTLAGIVFVLVRTIQDELGERRDKERKEAERRQAEQEARNATEKAHREEQQRCRKKLIALGEESMVLF